ncbi:hypothetical protein B0J14DRAFT_661073 [Halenospora varia]|nr:hypothetical protein B0J14DRAFT_661073 [Halenospora varia]
MGRSVNDWDSRQTFGTYLAKSTSKSAAIFRRYDELALSNILRLSSKLTDIATSIKRIHYLEQDERPANAAILDQKLSETLKEYYVSLDLYSKMLSFDAPASRTVEAIQKWLRLKKINEHDIEVEGHGYPDLISLHAAGDNDLLSRLASTWLKVFFIDYRNSKRNEYYYLDERRIRRVVTFVGMVLAVGFLVGAMWVLWREGDDMIAKLATVTGFVVGFGIWVGFFTSAGRKEVITATAAYAAVLVVFVSNG